jgi:hypothetical protein
VQDEPIAVPSVTEAFAAVAPNASIEPARIPRIAPRINHPFCYAPRIERAAVKHGLTNVCCVLLIVFLRAIFRHRERLVTVFL